MHYQEKRIFAARAEAIRRNGALDVGIFVDEFDDTAKNLGLGPFKILQKIHLPINLSALIIAFIVTFVDLMKELPITLILRPFNFDTLATQTYEFAIEEMLKESSIYSLIIILIGCLFLFILKNIINNFSNAS